MSSKFVSNAFDMLKHEVSQTKAGLDLFFFSEFRRFFVLNSLFILTVTVDAKRLQKSFVSIGE